MDVSTKFDTMVHDPNDEDPKNKINVFDNEEGEELEEFFPEAVDDFDDSEDEWEDADEEWEDTDEE